jgi:hypothetical protein
MSTVEPLFNVLWCNVFPHLMFSSVNLKSINSVLNCLHLRTYSVEGSNSLLLKETLTWDFILCSLTVFTDIK